MKIVAIVNTYGTIKDKNTGKNTKYESKKVVAVDEYERDGERQCLLVVCKCSPNFNLPVGTVFEPVYDRFGRIVGKC